MNNTQNTTIFILNNKINVFNEETLHELTSQAYTRYIKNTNEIKTRNQWKTSGAGAMFTGAYNPSDFPTDCLFQINDITSCHNSDEFIYSASAIDFSCIYRKSYINDSMPEKLIYSNREIVITDIDFRYGKLLAAISDQSIETHIAVFDINKTGYDFITDGDSIEENPSWSKINNNILFYNCKGIGRDVNGNIVGYSPRYICRLDISSGTIDELASSEKYEFLKPQEDSQGNLFYIRIPHKEVVSRNFLKDILLAPFRLIKGIFGFLNFFTLRYTGESLRTNGSNPSKARVKSEKDLFIEGNIINAQKNIKENHASGDKYPGIAPKSWELRRLDRDGNEICVKKGIIDFDLLDDGNILYSNGHFIIKTDPSFTEDVLVTKAATTLKVIGVQ